MTQSERDPQYAPHVAIDLRDQNSMFLALEELGIAQMQDAWIQKNQPEHEDAPAVHEQAVEFMDDMVHILGGHADESRIVANGWAGEKLSAHVKLSLAGEIKRLHRDIDIDALDMEGVIRAGLECYVNDLKLLTERDQLEKMMGREVPAQEYIDFMIGWSAIFAGTSTDLQLPQNFLLWKASKLR